jgi:hypothetical protein
VFTRVRHQTQPRASWIQSTPSQGAKIAQSVWQQVSIPGRGKRFLPSPVSRLALGPTRPHIQWVQGPLSPGAKRPGREANRSPPSSAEVKNGGAIPPLPKSLAVITKCSDQTSSCITQRSVERHILMKCTYFPNVFFMTTYTSPIFVFIYCRKANRTTGSRIMLPCISLNIRIARTTSKNLPQNCIQPTNDIYTFVEWTILGENITSYVTFWKYSPNYNCNQNLLISFIVEICEEGCEQTRPPSCASISGKPYYKVLSSFIPLLAVHLLQTDVSTMSNSVVQTQTVKIKNHEEFQQTAQSSTSIPHDSCVWI